MPGGATEAVIELHRPPRLLFAGQNATLPEANLIRFRLGHNDGLTMSLQAKAPGGQIVTKPVDLTVDFAAALGHRREAYERLLDDAMDGRRHRFAREDTIEEEWRIVEPILDHSDRPAPLLQRHLGTLRRRRSHRRMARRLHPTTDQLGSSQLIISSVPIRAAPLSTHAESWQDAAS